jgi:hypothetical protein
MAKNPTEKTLADYVAIAISPALIMALVGSLVFFLVAVLYHGEYVGRLHWILFFFVFGAVLIARMSMQHEVADRAGIYGLILGLLVWIALLTYVDWQNSGELAPYGWLIDLGLIAIIWWCAHRLTWDCTLIDDAVDASGAGLLQVAGLEGKPGEAAAPQEEEEGGDGAKDPEPAEKLPGLVGWWERYRRYREEQKRKPHAPGVWVVYFSLAALPLFGLGQALIPANELGRRQYVFWLTIVYVGSGLGLLLTTSFLGLRRYLRQRRLQMPLAMTGAWLTGGGLLIGALLIAGVLMPRPNAEYRPLDWEGLVSSNERQASDLDVKGGTAGKDKGREAGQKPRDAGRDREGGKREGEGEAKDQGDEAKDQGHEKDGQARGKDGRPRDKDGQDGAEKDGKGDKAGQDGGERTRDKGNKGEGKPRDEARDRGEREQDRRDDEARKDGGEAPEKDRDQTDRKDSRRDQQPGGPPPEPRSNFLPNLSRQFATVLKWIIGIVLALVMLFVLLRAGLKFLANFTHWARRLLAALRSFWGALLAWFAGGKGGEEDEGEEEAEAAKVPRPFSAFRDPFVSGEAEAMSNGRLVRYSFEALQAWAWERGLGRQPGETPLEFADRVGEEFPALEHAARRLVNYYAQMAYARATLSRACREPLREFWQLLVEVVERPMSAGVGSA